LQIILRQNKNFITYLLQVPIAEIPVNWHDVEGSKLNIVEDSIKMARDFLLVRILYVLRMWKYSDDIGY